jgi:acyl carrier protein
MEQEQILGIMKEYFAELHGPEQLKDFENIRAADLIEDSVDAVTFVMHLEDETGRDIPMAQVAAGFTGLTFQELARQLASGELGVVPGASTVPTPALQ